MMNCLAFLFLFLNFFHSISGQSLPEVKIHSHNDYNQPTPFWSAFYAGAESIEVDVFFKNDKLYVTHAEDEVVERKTLEKLYLNPLDSVCKLDSGIKNEMILLIDIKSEAYSTLAAIERVLKKFVQLIENPWLKIVISGERPKLSDYPKYPAFIYFDYQSREALNKDRILKKIAMVSLDFADYSKWDGHGELPIADQQIVKEIVKEAQDKGKPFRFWDSPDTSEAWSVLSSLGVDYINTDRPAICKKFFEGSK